MATVNASFDEPTIPPRVRRALAAVWVSLGLHAAAIALIQVAPPGAVSSNGPVIEARLVSGDAQVAATETPVDPADAAPVLTPDAWAEVLPAPPAVFPPDAAQPAAAVPAEPAPAPALAITSAVDLIYYSMREIDVLPRALREIVPGYPEDADRQRLSGTVRLRLELEADGRVSDIEVVSADPPGVFEDSAVKAFRDARFTPALKNGRPVRVWVMVPVEYDWEGRPR
ncbi:MAG: energy transducer TonB [Hydrogenophilales bacterium 17-61-9]|nr:MAG: energy transducer TonB [Hydrogenophilales bacterium 17-61-9]